MAQTTFTIDNDRLTVTVERIFDAPVARVWQALTDPTLIPSWWGGKESPTVVDKMDARTEGEWRFIRTSSAGAELAFSGKYLDVKPEHFLAQTFNFEPSGPDHESTRTTTLEDAAGHTKMTGVFAYKTEGDLKTDLEAGMEAGTQATWERLDKLLSSEL